LPDGIGFAFVDGDHGGAAVESDVEKLWPKMAPGGIMMLDDTNSSGQNFDNDQRKYLIKKFPNAIHFIYGEGHTIVQKEPVYIIPTAHEATITNADPILWRG